MCILSSTVDSHMKFLSSCSTSWLFPATYAQEPTMPGVLQCVWTLLEVAKQTVPSQHQVCLSCCNKFACQHSCSHHASEQFPSLPGCFLYGLQWNAMKKSTGDLVHWGRTLGVTPNEETIQEKVSCDAYSQGSRTPNTFCVRKSSTVHVQFDAGINTDEWV